MKVELENLYKLSYWCVQANLPQAVDRLQKQMEGVIKNAKYKL